MELDLEYYKNNAIAFEFHSPKEHRELLDLFTEQRLHRVEINGHCAFWLEEPTYSCEPDLARKESYYKENGFEIILASEFLTLFKDPMYLAMQQIKKEIGI